MFVFHYVFEQCFIFRYLIDSRSSGIDRPPDGNMHVHDNLSELNCSEIRVNLDRTHTHMAIALFPALYLSLGGKPRDEANTDTCMSELQYRVHWIQSYF